ncbi:hypothetical protein AVEN_93746-1 [Araneus ventricosus]|uniref:Uncharacterized protein n=1 Tax=Araneus ventricosus TaxID=182803 RepID=A0A4Y2J8D3_ARAVE|nr:hypothetical protein AVEN_93746-1 [Araneus ventricosus]
MDPTDLLTTSAFSNTCDDLQKQQPSESGVEASEAEPGRGIRIRPDPLLRWVLDPIGTDLAEGFVLRRLREAGVQSVPAFH